MKKLSFIFLLFVCLPAVAQVTTREKVCEGMWLGRVTALNTDGEISLVWTADDMQYQHIAAFITVYSGSPKDLINFCDELLSFAEEHEKDASTQIHGTHVSIGKMMGAQQFTIYEKTESGALNGYRQFTPKQVSNIKNKVLKWAEKNSIVI